MNDETQLLSEKIAKSPFKNVYWFARDLINTDEYGAPGKSRQNELIQAATTMESILTRDDFDDAHKVPLCINVLRQVLAPDKAKYTKQEYLMAQLMRDLKDEIKTVSDVAVFCITIKYVVAPINEALKAIPSNDQDYARSEAKAILDTYGEKDAGAVIRTWDRNGVRGSLNAERAVVVNEFSHLLDRMRGLSVDHSKLDDDLLMTAFMQEFERRLGQKRKARSGRSLETAVSFLFDYYKFPSSPQPVHFQQDLEIDKWFKCSDGWKIGISCKRTLRERWKQVSSGQINLSDYKIKELWNIMTYDRDLSDDKIVRLGGQRAYFYLYDDSPVYKRAKSNKGMASYVRPLSHLIEDIREDMGRN